MKIWQHMIDTPKAKLAYQDDPRYYHAVQMVRREEEWGNHPGAAIREVLLTLAIMLAESESRAYDLACALTSPLSPRSESARLR